MTALLDTNAFYWAVTGSVRLTMAARTLLLNEAEDVLVSPLMHYELSQKHSSGKLNLTLPAREFVAIGMAQLKASELPLSLKHTGLSDTMGWHHRDPFDRMLALQALAESIPIVSSDEIFDRYGLHRIW